MFKMSMSGVLLLLPSLLLMHDLLSEASVYPFQVVYASPPLTIEPIIRIKSPRCCSYAIISLAAWILNTLLLIKE